MWISERSFEEGENTRGVMSKMPFLIGVKGRFPECTWSGNLDKRVLTRGRDAIKKEVEYKVPFMLL